VRSEVKQAIEQLSRETGLPQNVIADEAIAAVLGVPSRAEQLVRL